MVGLFYHGYSQSYTASWEVGNETKLVHLYIDTDFSGNSVVIEKEYVETPQGTTLQNDDLVLLGGFEAIGGNYKLNYVDYLYYVVPFDPEEPIYILNNIIPSEVTQGTFIFEGALGGPGDENYWCDCGGEGPTASDPGGCVSQLAIVWMGPKIVRCVKDGDECSFACLGTSTPAGLSTGGGVIVQVPKEKDLLFHNIKTRN